MEPKPHEHILVCLSSAPSNAHIIRTAATMAEAFGAQFTALYVQTRSAEQMSLAERSNLQARTYLAEQLGATIVTVPGDDVPYQIAEFARLSKVTKVVMGRSNAPNRLLPYKPLNEKLIERAPELDIYIIPDISGENSRRRNPSLRTLRRPSLKQWLLTLGVLLLAAANRPDILFLDLGLPDMDGVELIRRLRIHSQLPIIVISARSEDSDKIAALDAGADDYLTKPFSVEELLARVRATQRRLLFLHSPGTDLVFANGALRIDYGAGAVWLGSQQLHLTPMEYKLLCTLAQNVGRVLTHNALMMDIWGSTTKSDLASLRVCMAALRKKLNDCNPEAEYLHTHIGLGYSMNRL